MAMEDATLIKRGHQTFVLRAVSTGEEHTLQGEMLVGREVECAINLNSGHISRYHAKINVSPNGVYVEDLHSTNGTFVNGQKIKGRVRLAVGDEVTFDDISFRLTSNASGRSADTIMSRRPVIPEINRPQEPVRRPDIPRTPMAPRPVRPSVAPPRPEALQELDELLNSVEAPKEKPAANIPPGSPDLPEDRTQFLSASQLDRLVERGRHDQDLQVGSGPRFIVMTAPLRGKLFELEAAPVGTNWQIGRDPASEICLNDKTISNDHARLAKTPDGFVLTATHAKNGILVNGNPKNRAFLRHNDRIQIGRTELVFKTDANTKRPTQVPAYESLSENTGSRRYSIIITVVALVVLITALFATSR